MADTLAAVRKDLHELALKVEGGQARSEEREARSEERHEAVMGAIERIDRRLDDMSDQGRPPDAKSSGSWKLAPGTGREIAWAIVGILAGLGLIGGPAAGIALQRDAPAQPPAVAAPVAP